MQAGAAGSPWLWLVASRPAHAIATECQQPSAYGSMNTSGPGRTPVSCSGRAPSYWADPANFAKWPAPYYAAMDRNGGDVLPTQFHATGCTGSYFGGRTMVDVLQMEGQGGYADLGAHVCAGMLNAAAGLTPVLTVPRVIEIWNECSSRGYYEPTAGERWYPEQVCSYLRTTMPG